MLGPVIVGVSRILKADELAFESLSQLLVILARARILLKGLKV